MKNYILFDLDGTITDPMEGITKSAQHALRFFGIERTQEELKSIIGPPLMDSFHDQFGLDEEQAQKALGLYREYFGPTGLYENELYEGVEEMLIALREQGKVILLATSKPEPFARTILEHFGLYKYFAFIVGSTMEETRTKKSEVIAYALEQIGNCPVDEVVMVGDRVYDVDGAKAFGMDCIGVLYGYGSWEELSNAGADYLVNTVPELQNVLLQM